ncbi:MAG: glutathionylspermidine synthase family protein [Opitutaceae bacterium]|nr:glutathionylspermidine synthase family protein [Opitutaceae bacterium]
MDALFRFFPVEWLPNLDGGAWKNFFMPAKFPRTLLINPGCAVVSQSKGFPFAWDALSRGAPRTWAALMPETRPLDGAGRGWLARLFRPARLPDAAEWVLKPAMGRVGDGVGLAGATRARDMAGILKNCRRHPRHWAAQRRFESEPLATPHGARHVCVGVYVINGCACGIYGRISPAPLIDYLAQDVAVLVARESGGGAGEAREAAEGRGGAARAALDEGILS